MYGRDIGSHAAQFFGGLFGNSDAPYNDAMKQYQEWANKAQSVQNPFLDFGKSGMPLFQDWLSKMKDPSTFINNLMGKYQESPFAKFQQEQAVRRANNAGSTGSTEAGGIGSTPMTQFMEQNASNISSQDMQNWLAKVLGINTEYGTGLNQEIGVGQNASNALTNLFNEMGSRMGEAAYGRAAGRNQDRTNMWGGLFNLAGDAGSLFL